jgi:hypothetical protein
MKVGWSRQAGTPTSPKVLEQRLSVGIHRISAKLSYSSKLELRNPIRPQRILTDLSRLSYVECSRQARGPSGPQSLATLPTRLRLTTTLWTRALQVEFPSNCVCIDFHCEGGIYRGEWDLHQLGEVSFAPSSGRAAKSRGWLVSPTPWPLGPFGLGFGPFGPYVKYTPMVMMILTFAQLHFVIPWNAPIWYLSSWNQINTKIMELG